MQSVLIGAVVAALAGIGCGGGAPPAGASTETLDSSRVAQPHAESRHAAPAPPPPTASTDPGMAPEIRHFHDALAPRWHAEHGPKRMADTCGAIGELHTRATEIVDAAPPAGASPIAWAKSGKALEQAVFDLSTTCKANDATAFEPAFDKVHDRFHEVMEASGGEKDADGDAKK